MNQQEQKKEIENIIYAIRYQQIIEGQTLMGIFNFYKTQLSAQKGLQKLTDYYTHLGYTIEYKEEEYVKLTDNHNGSQTIYVSPQYIEP